MLQQFGQGRRIKAHLLQLVGKPLDALLELRVRDGGIDPLWREALIPECLLEQMAELHIWGKVDEEPW